VREGGSRASRELELSWLGVVDGLLRGINHSLSNRVVAIGALAEVLAPDEPPGAELVDAIAAEARKLNELLHTLRRLPRGAGASPSSPSSPHALHLPDLLQAAVSLHTHDAMLGDVSCDVQGAADVLPVVATEEGVVHATLALIAAAKQWAAGATPAEPVRLRYWGDDTLVTVVVSAGGGADDAGMVSPAADGAPAVPTPSAARVVRWLLAGTGAEVTESAGETGVRYVLRLPTLPEVRRRARAAEMGAESPPA